jgi:hypothetical protein
MRRTQQLTSRYVKSLYPRSAYPMPGESLEGLLLRAGCENGFSFWKSLELLGVSNNHALPMAPGTLSGSKISAEAVVSLIGNEGGRDEVHPLFWSRSPNERRRRPFFHTSLVHGALTSFRRVSPRALKRSPHLRAIWQVRALEFDPETKELLIDKCPGCGKTLGMKFMGDVWCCDNCCEISPLGELIAVDLREYPQRLVEQCHWRHLDFATSFIDPTKQDERIKNRAKLHSDFAEIDDGAMFDFICAIARSIAMPIDKSQSSQIEASVLAQAGEIIEGWPESFADLVAHGDGGTKQLLNHPLRYLFYHVRVPKSLRETMRALERGTRVKAIGVQAYAQAYRPTALPVNEYRALHRFQPGAVASSALEMLLALFRANREVTDFCKSFGIAVPSLLDMMDDKILPTALGRQDGLQEFHATAVSLFHEILRKRTDGQPPEDSVRLSQAAVALYARGGDPWPNIVRVMIAGHIEYWIAPDKRSSFLERIQIRDLESLAWALALPETSLDKTFSLPISAMEAPEFIRLWRYQLSRVKRLGLLAPPYTRAKLGAFSSTYENGISVRIRLQTERQVLSKLQVRERLWEAGVRPVFDDERKRAIWRRSDVDEVFAGEIRLCVR